MVYILREYCFHDSHIVCILKLCPVFFLVIGFFQATLKVAAALQYDTWISFQNRFSKLSFK